MVGLLIIEILDIVGTAAFAVSGGLVAIKNKLDLFGVFVLAIITASGGGLIRDTIIRQGMPVFFTQSRYLVTIAFTTIIVILGYKYIRRILFLIKVFDAIGLGVFTVITAYRSLILGVPFIGIVFVATLTGIGGGILRDILVNDVPLVFKSEIYALAAIIGAICFYFLYGLIEVKLNVYICISIVSIIRITAIHFNMNLPVLPVRHDSTDKGSN